MHYKLSKMYSINKAALVQTSPLVSRGPRSGRDAFHRDIDDGMLAMREIPLRSVNAWCPSEMGWELFCCE